MKNVSILTGQEQKALSLFKKEVQKICGASGWEIKVFGSRARQEGSENSDVDVLILLSKPDQRKKIAIWDAAYHVFSKTDILVSAHVLSMEQFDQMKKRERLIAKNIERDGFAI